MVTAGLCYDGLRNIVRLLGDEEVIELPEGFSQRLYQTTASGLLSGRSHRPHQFPIKLTPPRVLSLQIKHQSRDRKPR